MMSQFLTFLALFFMTATPVVSEEFVPVEIGPLAGDDALLTSDEDRVVNDRKFFEKAEESLRKESMVVDGYRLRVGDTIQVSIYGEANTERVLTVDSHGGISYLLIDRVLAVGKTINELRKEINDKLREKLRFALVNVVPVRFGGLHYTLLGEIEIPGKKPIVGTTTLLEALASGGGFRMGYFRDGTVDLADLHYAFVARNGEYVPVDFYALIVEGDVSQNIEIKNNDYIYIPSSLNRQIYVLGQVNLPANIGYLNNQTLLGAIAKARGITPLASDDAYIIRGSLAEPQKIKVNLHKMFRGEEPDILLKPGDIVFVPPRQTLFIEDILKTAIRSFVWASAHVMGREAFEEVHPHAAGSGSFNAF